MAMVQVSSYLVVASNLLSLSVVFTISLHGQVTADIMPGGYMEPPNSSGVHNLCMIMVSSSLDFLCRIHYPCVVLVRIT